MTVNKHWVSLALALAAGVVGCLGHDVRGIVLGVVLVEFFA